MAHLDAQQVPGLPEPANAPEPPPPAPIPPVDDPDTAAPTREEPSQGKAPMNA